MPAVQRHLYAAGSVYAQCVTNACVQLGHEYEPRGIEWQQPYPSPLAEISQVKLQLLPLIRSLLEEYVVAPNCIRDTVNLLPLTEADRGPKLTPQGEVLHQLSLHHCTQLCDSAKSLRQRFRKLAIAKDRLQAVQDARWWHTRFIDYLSGGPPEWAKELQKIVKDVREEKGGTEVFRRPLRVAKLIHDAWHRSLLHSLDGAISPKSIEDSYDVEKQRMKSLEWGVLRLEHSVPPSFLADQQA